MPSPLLSVVVPIFNVGSYLLPCLESLTQGTLGDLEIVCVDDGSTDGSGELADEFASTDARVRVLHVENGGLGKARNIGADAARGRYLAFVDSDDRVTARAYELMCGSLEATGSDIVAGRVRRFTDTRSWRSGLHTQAIPRAARRTHISKIPALVYDTTAWNKVYRRTFWDEHKLRFPEGVLYEDMPVTIPAHVLASSVDLLTQVVYEWRERGDGSMSITQRRAEYANLRDRLAALEHVSDFVAERDLPNVQRAHDKKVLTLDIPLYLAVLDVADAPFRKLFAEHMRRYLEHVDDATLAQVDPWDRVAFELVRRGRLEQTVEVVRQRKAMRGDFDVVRKGSRLYAQLPFFDDPAGELPRSVYDVTTKLPVRCSVDELTVEADDLVLTGFALIEKVPLARPWSAVRYLDFRDKDGGHRIVRPMRPQHRPALTELYGTAGAGYDQAGFRARVPLARFRAPEAGASLYTVQVKIVTAGGRRGVPLARSRQSWALRGVHLVRPDGTFLSAHTVSTGALQVTARRRYVLAEQAGIDAAGDTLTLRLRFAGARPAAGAVLAWGAEDESDVYETPLTPDAADPQRMTAVCDLRALRLDSSVAPQRVWRATVDVPSAPEADRTLPVLAESSDALPHHEDTRSGREVSVGVGANGRVVLTDRIARARVRTARWDGGGLTVRLDLPQSARTAAVALTTGDGARLEPAALERDDAAVTAHFDVFDPQARTSIRPGTWTLRVGHELSGEDDWLVLDVDDAACRAGAAGADHPRAEVRATPTSLAVLVVANRLGEVGAHNQQRLRAHTYRQDRRRPLADTLLFQSWAGKQYSDSPRAIYEELRRQGRDEPMLWVRRDTSVAVPDGTRAVVWGSREYYEALATAKYVISNDAMPPYYVKREGSNYLQTWHGTPLKRIGFDIENAQFGNVNYLDEFAVEVTKWDQLVAPNRFSTEIFRRAFRYEGTVLETGYPRNDVFYAADAEQRRADVRTRLGLHPHQRVILWAPTWREDQRDARGRYSLPLPFDPQAWSRILEPDDVVLFRGHQLLQATVGSRLRGLAQVRNVTMYPDVQELYLAADILVTDYSSVMFDFANTRRPMVFYAWDLEHYRDRLRGFYLDFETTVPGPVVTDFLDLRQALADAGSAAHAERYAAFVERFCGLEDGRAAARVIEAVFGA